MRPVWRDRWFLVGLALILLVGTALRTYRLDSLPPGLAYDEAWEGIDGRRILDGARPLFLPDNNGREPAFAYSAALTIGLLGQTPTAVRAAAALWGVLTIGAMAVLGGALSGRRLALAAAGLVAVSYWPIHLSRVGLRPVALPPFEALGIGLLLAAFASRGRMRWGMAAGSGAALGLQLYTYVPGRLTLVVALFAILAARRRIGIVVILLLLLVAAPLGLHFLRHPEDWLGRAEQVSVMNAIRTGADPVATIGANLRDTLGALAVRGDMQARHDLPGRPIFDPWSFVLFLVGIVVAQRRVGWLAAATLYVWLALMLGPAVLSDSAPHFLRAVGALPPLFVFAAFGLIWVVEQAALWLRRPGGFAYWLAAIPLLLTGLAAGRDYFDRFADPAVSAEPFDADLSRIAGELNHRRPANALVGPVEPDHPALRFLLRGEPPTTFPVQALPLRAGDYFVRQREGTERLAALRTAFPSAVVRPLGSTTEVQVAPGSAPAAPKPILPSSAHFGAVELLGADASPAAGGREMPLRLYWRARQTPGEGLTVFVHLVDAGGVGWAQQDLAPGAGGFPTTAWRAGDVVLDDWRLPLPPGVPPGEYQLRVGLVRADGSPVARADGPGDFAALGPVRVERSAGRLNLYRLRLTARTERELSAGAARVDLVGYRLDVDRLDAGRALPVLLAWEWRGAAPGLRVELALETPSGANTRRRESVGGRWPTEAWGDTEFVQQRVELAVPPTFPAGEAALSLQLVGPGGERSERLPLGKVAIQSRPRVFEAPSPAQPIGARFGEFAELVGFDPPAGEVSAGATVKTTLYWRARATPSDDFVVFLHLLGPGDRVVGQVDSPPAGGVAPTRSWLPGEVIRDERSFQVKAGTPPGTYRFEAGLYRPGTGQRVRLADGSGDRVLFGQLTVR